MTRPRQKADEKQLLQHYIDAFGISGTIEDCPEAQGDFIVHIGVGQSINVQVTEYHQLKDENERYAKKLVEQEWLHLSDFIYKCKESHSDLDSIAVFLQFKEWHLPAKIEFPIFVDAIWNLLRNELPRIQKARMQFRQCDLSPVLAKYVDRISARKAGSIFICDSNIRTHGPVGTSEKELIEILERKLHRDKVKSTLSENHLILVSTAGSVSTDMGTWFAHDVEGYTQLTKMLEDSAYGVFAIIGRRTVRWKRCVGWSCLDW